MKKIIITVSENQVKKLHEIVNRKFNNIGFWGEQQMNYDTEWIWVLKDNDLSGASGLNTLRNTISQNPGAEIYHYTDFIDSINIDKKSTDVNIGFDIWWIKAKLKLPM